MALKKCPECGGKVSEGASACPHCGHGSHPVVIHIQQIIPSAGSGGNVLSAICSIFIPGLGQLVQGRVLPAVCFFLLAVGVGVLTCGFGAPVIGLLSVIDAALYSPGKKSNAMWISAGILLFSAAVAMLMASLFMSAVDDARDAVKDANRPGVHQQEDTNQSKAVSNIKTMDTVQQEAERKNTIVTERNTSQTDKKRSVHKEIEKVTGQSVWSMSGEPVDAASPKGMKVSTSARTKNNKTGDIDTVIVTFKTQYSTSVNEGEFSKDDYTKNRMQIIADGKEIVRGFTFNADVINGEQQEIYKIFFPIKILSDLTLAKKLSVQAGGVSFTIPDGDKNLLTELIVEALQNNQKELPVEIKNKTDVMQLGNPKQNRTTKNDDTIAQQSGSGQEAKKKAIKSLKTIKTYLLRQKPELAQKKLKELVEKYPDTEAAEEAKKLITE